MRRTTPLVLCLLLGVSVYAQKVAIKRVEVTGERIIVYYDLEDSNPNNEYQINLYSSQSNFVTALTKVKGDVGSEVKSGINKRIEWNVKEEAGPYKGRLALEVRGRVYIPIAKINNISAGDNFKRGKSRVITWKPGSSNPVNIELMKGGHRISGELNQPNNGSFTLYIPEHAEIGKDYTIKITDNRSSEDFVSSQPFHVRRKVPLLLKVAPILVVGGVAAFLGGGGGGGDGGGGGGGAPKLPAPPEQN